MWIVQNGYIDRISKSYNLQASLTKMSPLAPDYDMSPNLGPKLTADLIQNFQRKVGSVIYAAICTRPDIALAVSMCTNHLINPAIRHIHAITHILQYLVNTKHYGILYDSSLTKNTESSPEVLFMASDASFGDNEGRKSSQGFVAFLFGRPVVWHSNKQRSVTTSTTEAELVALTAAARELIALKRFVKYVTGDHNFRMTSLCDNQQTVKILTQKIHY
ncbi:hypothetical protein K3495_g14839 [Podosphaera aphanis]|nr:hypothetical protein K3495_g14839 [Podosphaera aphanis]